MLLSKIKLKIIIIRNHIYSTDYTINIAINND